MNSSFVMRLDVSPTVGLGHYMRCRVLAQTLRSHGASVAAVVRRCASSASVVDLSAISRSIVFVDESASPVEDAAIVADTLCSTDADVLILDSYVANEDYQLVLQEAGARWLQFDSHGTQALWADWVLNASPGAEREGYESLLRRNDSRLLLGPRFAVLDTVFESAHSDARPRTQISRVFVCLGGGDDRAATLKVLEQIAPVAESWDAVDVVIGSQNPNAQEIEALLQQQPFRGLARLHVGTPEVPSLMSSADLAIVSGGTLTYECCATGLPMVLVSVAENQFMNARGWVEEGVALYVGSIEELEQEILLNAYELLASSPQQVREMSAAALELVDGRGAQRVTAELLACPDSNGW